ncbi:MAG: hypothetical protein ABFR97_09850 [Thermodesulfobacteriota bacterium]
MRGVREERGFALVVVILILLMVSFLAAELTLGVRSETSSGFNERQQVVGRTLAQAGINLALFHLLDEPVDGGGEGASFEQGESQDVWLAQGRVRYQVVSEAGKMDLNNVDPRLLSLLLEYFGYSEEEADIVNDSLLDWRDNDDLHRLNGAESEYYAELAEPYQARNGKIMDANEFFLLKGTAKLATRMRAADIFTVHNRKKRLAFNDLTPAMLAFLTGGDEESMALYHDLRQEEGLLDAAGAMLVLGEERFGMFKPYLSYGKGSGTFYSIVATGFAGESKDDETAQPDRPSPGSRVSVLLEKRGRQIFYRGWQEEWS